MRNLSQHFVTEEIKLNDDGEPFIPHWTGFDLDGTMAKYDTWQGHEHIGEPIQPVIGLMRQILADGGLVKVFTARVSCQSEALNEKVRAAIRAYCKEHVGQELDITNIKDRGMVKLYDDRAVQVIKNTGVIVEMPRI